MSINAIIHTFEGEPLQTLERDGKPCWVARHIGARIGYENNGKKFAAQILQSWKDEMQEGVHYAYLVGDDASDVGRIVAQVGQHGGGRILVLFEPGLWLALTKTRKAAGVRLRSFLSEEVLPQIARTGTYTPATAPAAEATLVARMDARLDALEHRMIDAIASTMAVALQPVGQALTALANAVTVLAQHPPQSHAATSAQGVTVHTGGAQILLAEPQLPEGFTVRGLTRLAEVAGCSADKMKKRLQAVGLWEDTAWVWQGFEPVVRGGRVKQERLYMFRKGVLAELQLREQPLFNGGGEAK